MEEAAPIPMRLYRPSAPCRRRERLQASPDPSAAIVMKWPGGLAAGDSPPFNAGETRWRQEEVGKMS